MCNTTSIDMHPICRVTAHPHLLVQTTSVQFLSARATFRIDLTSESFWMQTMLNSPFTSGHTNKCGWAISFNPFVYFIGKSSKHKVLPLYSRYTLNPLPGSQSTPVHTTNIRLCLSKSLPQYAHHIQGSSNKRKL